MRIDTYILKIKNRGLRCIKRPYYILCFGRFGKYSEIQKPLRLYDTKNMYIGDHVIIMGNGRMECITNWGTKGYEPKLIIGDNTVIGQGTHITCAGKLIIGKNCMILPYVLITDITHTYECLDVSPLYSPIEVSETLIGDSCLIGMGARIMPGVKIGCHSVVGANAVVTQDVPDYSVVAGIPAKVIKYYDFSLGKWKKTNVEVNEMNRNNRQYCTGGVFGG